MICDLNDEVTCDLKKDPDFNLAAFMEENDDNLESSDETGTNVRSVNLRYKTSGLQNILAIFTNLR